MNIEDFSAEQSLGLLELLVLGMYCDGHLAAAEDDTLRQYAGRLGLRADYDLDQALDLVVTKTTGRPRTPDSIRNQLVTLAGVFGGENTRRVAWAALEDLLRSDAKEGPEEARFAGLVKEVFQL